VKAGVPIAWRDIAIDEALPALKVRRDMEALFGLSPVAQRVA